VKVETHSGSGTHAIKFFTRENKTSNWFGQEEGEFFDTFRANTGQELCAISGRSSALLENALFHFDKPAPPLPKVTRVICVLKPSMATNVDFLIR